ncbi:MAG: fumarylacetoacetate hydrolase family protein [Candidatus Omnitrophica bacterium]|nr:fumarylacetoacetate hydrolase family protein [Candidatus Omnitrophota bacterium]
MPSGFGTLVPDMPEVSVMRIIRFLYQQREYWGAVEGQTVRFLAEPPFVRIRFSRRRCAGNAIRLLVPATASKIVLVGLNYRDHAAELGMPLPEEPVLFLKPPSALVAAGGLIRYPAAAGRVDYEAELALVIRRRIRRIKPAQAEGAVFGYTCLNDVTARDLQKRDGQWTRAKSFDTFCPVGPWVDTRFSPDCARIRAVRNGITVQDSSTAHFVFPIPYLVSYISSIMTLLPGDIISTGTPPGVGPLQPGDTIAVDIEGLGILRNRVARR